LVNNDYKILSSIIAHRLLSSPSRSINQNQKCGLPRRRIKHILYNVQAAYEITTEKNEALGLMLLDLKKLLIKYLTNLSTKSLKS